MIETTYCGTLIKAEDGEYGKYIFLLENGNYLLCTRLPNWESRLPLEGDEGYVTVNFVNAGEKYYNPKTQQDTIYNYTNVYFKNFVKIQHRNKRIIL